MFNQWSLLLLFDGSEQTLLHHIAKQANAANRSKTKLLAFLWRRRENISLYKDLLLLKFRHYDLLKRIDNLLNTQI